MWFSIDLDPRSLHKGMVQSMRILSNANLTTLPSQFLLECVQEYIPPSLRNQSSSLGSILSLKICGPLRGVLHPNFLDLDLSLNPSLTLINMSSPIVSTTDNGSGPQVKKLFMHACFLMIPTLFFLIIIYLYIYSNLYAVLMQLARLTSSTNVGKLSRRAPLAVVEAKWIVMRWMVEVDDNKLMLVGIGLRVSYGASQATVATPVSVTMRNHKQTWQSSPLAPMVKTTMTSATWWVKAN